MAAPLLPPPSESTTSMVSRSTIEKAVGALMKWKETQSIDQKPQLIPKDDFIYLSLTLKKIPPKSRTNPFRIPLSHPIHDPSSEICLIIDDRPNSNLTSETAKKLVKALNLPISKVLKLSKLKTDYKPFEAKRKLCDSYDLFLVDRRIVHFLPKLLGKQFFKKKKLPLPIDLTHKNWKEQVERLCGSALLYLRTGTCCVMRVGRGSMDSAEIVENVVGAITGLAEIVPKKWGGVRSLHLKYSDSVALPLYQALPDLRLKIEGFRADKVDAGEMTGGELEGKDSERGAPKKGKKKGRIHEVRYMDVGIEEDDSGDEVVKDDELGNEVGEDENENEESKSEDDEMGSDKFVGKKRKSRGWFKKQPEGSDDDGGNDNLESAILLGNKNKGKKLVGKQASGELKAEKRAKKLGKSRKGEEGKRKKADGSVEVGEELGQERMKKKSKLKSKPKQGSEKAKDKKNKKI